MATYTIQAPDGNKYSVQGPDNASQEDVQAEVLRQHPDSGTATPKAGDTASSVTNYTLPDGSMHTAMAGNQIPANANVNGKQNATSGMSTSDKVIAGMGKAFNDTYVGAKELLSKAGDSVAGSEGTDVEAGPSQNTKSLQSSVAESRKLDRDLEATNAGKAGELLGHMVMGLAAPEGLGVQVAVGAAQGALTPTTAGESTGENIALGGALGAAGHVAGRLLGKIVGGVLQPFRSPNLSTAGREAVETLDSMGVPMNAGQQGAEILKSLSGNQMTLAQRQAFTQGVLKPLGVVSEDARPAVMEGIRARIGGVLDAQAEKNPIAVDKVLVDKLATIQAAAEATLSKENLATINKPLQQLNSYAPIERQIDNVLNYAQVGGGTLNGKLFANLRSNLSLMQKGDSGIVGHWAGEIQDAVTDALQRQASPKDVQAIQQARSAWRMMRQIEPGIDAENLVNPGRLWSSMDAMNNISQMVRGQGDQTLVKMAQAGKIVFGSNAAGGVKQAMTLATLGSSIGAVDALVQGKPMGATVGAGAVAGLVGVAGLKLAAENPATARIIGRWARSKLLANYRDGITAVSSRVGGIAGGAALPTMDGTDALGEENGGNQ